MGYFKAVSTCGYACQACMGLILVILASVAAASTWWIVYFWDCPNDDASYYLLLEKGLCFSNDRGTDDFDDCTEWEDFVDNLPDDEAADDAQRYIDALGLVNTALALCVIYLVVSLLHFVPFIRKLWFVRYINVAVVCIAGLMFVAAVGNASNTYYTDEENYVLFNNVCSSYATSGYTGYFGAVIGFILAFSAALALLFPCCNCVDNTPEGEGGQVNQQTQSQNQPSGGAVANPVAAPVMYK